MNRVGKDSIYLADVCPLVQNLKDRTLLITGVTGQIGKAMAHYLSMLNIQYGLGLKIYGQTRDAENARRSERLPQDIVLLESPLERLREQLNVDRLDAIIHLAAPTASQFFVTHPVETISTIVEGTRGVLECAREKNGTTVLYVSSMEVYGNVPMERQPAKESFLGTLDLLNPRSSYPMAKRMAEHLCLCYGKEYGIPVKIVRPCQTFGYNLSATDQRVYAQIARSVEHGDPVILHTTGEQSHCFCDTLDMVSALLYVLLKGENQGVYNIANPETYCSIRQMAEQVCAHFSTGSKVLIELDSTKGYPPVSHLFLDTERIQSLGWTPQKGLMEMYEGLIDSLQ